MAMVCRSMCQTKNDDDPDRTTSHSPYTGTRRLAAIQDKPRQQYIDHERNCKNK